MEASADGLKGAPCYFQRDVAQDVRGDLRGQQCELFLDNLIIFASKNGEMCKLEKRELPVIRRIKIHHRIEYVVHVIDKYGWSFSEEAKCKKF